MPAKTRVSHHHLMYGAVAVAVLSVMLYAPDVLALTDDTMKEGLTKLEATLTGSWMRIGLVVGGVIGTIMSFIKQSPMGIVVTAGTVLGSIFYTDWIKSAYTALI